MVRNIPLQDGARIAVIGSGPAGVFFSLFAYQKAIDEGRHVSIVLFDGKDFTQPGPKGCNLCAGVISETLVQRLEDRGIVLPREKVQRTIDGYYLQLRTGKFLLRHPQNESRITTVFRGNGPRLSTVKNDVSFDDFLLDQVKKRNLDIVSQPVVDIEFPENPEEKLNVVFGINDARSKCSVDLVVGAFGLNSALARKISELPIGYKSPQTLNAKCFEFEADAESIGKGLGNNILVCNWKSDSGMLFGGVIPKRDFVTVNIIGMKSAEKKDMVDFGELPFVRDRLSKHLDLSTASCQCSPKLALTSARKPYAHRFVVVGDASCSRYYKNGIESAMVTAETAVSAVFAEGVSESALRRHYYLPIKKTIIRDNIFGRILFGFYRLVYARSFLSAVLLRVLEREKELGHPGPMSVILWNMYTGNVAYKEIFFNLLRPNLQMKLIRETVILLINRIRTGARSASVKKKAGSE